MMDGKSPSAANPPRKRRRALNAQHESLLAEARRKRFAEIETRVAADEVRRIGVLQAWRRLYHVARRPRSSEAEAAHWRVWAARIIDTVSALKAADLIDRLDEINAEEGDTCSSNAAKSAVRVYRLAIDGNVEAVAKAVADAMRKEGPCRKPRGYRERFEEMLRWRIMIGVVAAEWGRFTFANMQRELRPFGLRGTT